MSNSILAHMFTNYWTIYIYIMCAFLATIPGMDHHDTYQTCEDLACENSNACQSSLINGTMAGNAYCTCRGEWVGLRCEVKLIVSAGYVTTEKITIEMHGLTFSGRDKVFTFKDLYISEMSVAVWNLNASDHCLLLRHSDPAEGVINLRGLVKDQEYIVCVTNGFVDSCSFFSNSAMNASGSTNCIYFKTRLFNEPPFDIGLVAVPCAVLIFILILTILIYIQRHSLLVQLCLNKLFCRSCYCCRKHILRRRRFMHKHRYISGEGLMTPDLPLDFESTSVSHAEGTEDSSHRWRHSSNASSLTSRRSAFYSFDEESMALPVSLDHNTFLYEDQTLIPPLYSPQDHKIMTLTFIDEDFISQNTDQPTYTHQVISPPDACSATIKDQTHIQDITNTNSLAQTLHIPALISHDITGNHVSASGHIQNKPEPCQTIGPVKPQYWNHPYLHRPYDKNHLFQHQTRSNRHRNRITCDYGVRYREANQPFLHQRPCSLPLKQTTSSAMFESNNLKHPHNSHLKHSHESFLTPLSSRSTIHPPKNDQVQSIFATNPTRLNHLLSSPSRYKGILKQERHRNIASQSCGPDGDQYTSNTLPRSRKPRFPITGNSFRDSGYELKSEKPFLSVLPHTSNNIPNFWLREDGLFNVTLPQQLNIEHDCLHNNQKRSNGTHFPALPHSTISVQGPWLDYEGTSNGTHFPALPHSTISVQGPWLDYEGTSNALLNTSPALQNPTWLGIQTKGKVQHSDTQSQSSSSNSVEAPSSSQSKSYVKSLISHFEHNLSFLKSSKPHHPTDEEKEFRDLQSPLAEERSKVSKKSRRSRPRDTPALTNQNYRHSLTSGINIFKGHPSEHVLLPFATDDEDDDEDVTESSTLNDISDETLSTSLPSGTKQKTISSFDDDDSNLVTPFVTDDSSDDDTYKDINSLSGSMETLQDDNIEMGHPLKS